LWEGAYLRERTTKTIDFMKTALKSVKRALHSVKRALNSKNYWYAIVGRGTTACEKEKENETNINKDTLRLSEGAY